MRTEVSIVIPTYHRKKSLLNLLVSLAPEINAKREIIIVEQKENNGREIKQFAKTNNVSVRYTYLLKPSTTRAMNTGARKAHGKFLLFLDDDVIATPGFINAHIKNFNNRKVAATCGRCITVGQPIEPDRTDTGRISPLGSFSNGFSSKIRQEIDTVIGCNTCWRKDIFRKLGGMDDRFTGNAMRLESDLSLRAKEAGYKIVFEPLALIHHLRYESGGARKTEGRMRWYFDFFSNETYFFLKHKPHLYFPLYLMLKSEWFLRCMFGFGREVSRRSFETPWKGIADGFRKYREIRT